MKDKYIVYILLSLKDKKLYIGCTSSLKKRIIRHMQGYVLATKDRRPLELLYYEVIESKELAFQRERFLKSLWSSRFKSYLKKLNLP